MNKKAHDQLIAARIGLLLDHYFFGRLAMHLKLVEKTDIPTLAVDGKHIFYNPDFVLQKLTPALTQSAFIHEIMHCVSEHFIRRGGRDPATWNAAGDYMINPVIREAGFKLGEGWLFEDRFVGMSTEHIYDILMQEQQRNKKQPPPSFDEVLDGAHSAGEAAEIDLEWKINVQQAVAGAKALGKMPAGMKRFMEEIEEPQVPWQQVLQRFITEISRNDYSWSRLNKKYVPYGYCLPSLHSESMGILATGIDESGSVDGPTLAAFGGEVLAAYEATHPEKLINIYCHSHISKVDEYEQGGEPPTFKSIETGGTDFRPPFRWLEKRDIKPAAFIYLTDGYGTFPEEQPDYPVLWCMTTDVVPPWGEHVRIKV
jgi:predicted metal-dependent peptidase